MTTSSSPASSALGGALDLDTALAQLADLLRQVDEEQYAAQATGAFESSVGAQVRHALDHVAAYVRLAEDGEVDYDERERGTDVERSAAAAIAMIDMTREALERLAGAAGDPDRPVLVRTSGASSAELRSTLGRELAFVFSHTIHHLAMISAMLRSLGVAVPPRFGYAPATIAHLNRR